MSVREIKKYDVVGNIMAFEDGELDKDGAIQLFIHLFNTGTINHLQGSYGRTGKSLLETGVIIKTDNGYVAGEV